MTTSAMPQKTRISPRIAAVAESATLAIDAKAKAMKAAGEPVIGFGAGEPDFPTPAHVVDAAAAACKDVKNHRYTPTSGLPELRDAIVAKTMRDSGYEIKASQVLVTNGGKQAVEQSLATILGEGDECILPAPYWTSYPEAIKLAGGVPVEVATNESTSFRVTVEMLEAARTAQTKALILCSPSNPTGSVYTREQLEAIGAWCVANGIWVMTDEIYEHLVYGEHKFYSLPVVCPEIADTCIVVNGVAKTYAMTGWRVGWMVGPVDVIAAATNLQSHATSNVNNVAQRAAIAALNGSLDGVAEMKVAYDRRRNTIHQMLNDIPGIVCPEPQGAFYAFASIKDLLGHTYGARKILTSMEFAAAVLEEAKVATVPGEAFGAPGYLRFSYALADDDLVDGITRLAKFVASAA